MPKTHQQLDPREITYAERQTLAIADFPCPPGWILDIGGGGDGIIGLVKGAQVVSIDILRSELQQVTNPALKIVMDARCLGFLDETFATAVTFFGLMYMTTADQSAVMAEILRVLKPGGELWIWDAAIPDPGTHTGKAMFMLPLTVVLPDGSEPISTGYGAPAKAQDLVYFTDLATRIGFVVLEATQDSAIVAMRLQKLSRGAG